MFGFKIWAKFGAFKDPMTISQNITINFPPKSAVSGMLAAVLGIDDFLEDDSFGDFKYSVVSKNVAKKSFSQNYINDYTKKTNSMLINLQKLDFDKISGGLRDTNAPQKPTNRELLINPSYIVFIKDFKFEDEIISNLKNRISRYSLYMGNSEFAANFKFIEIDKFENSNFGVIELDSFIEQSLVENIDFIDKVLYKNTLITTKLDKNRSPLNSINLIHSSDKIKAKNISAYEIKTKDKTYFCRFV